jgi:carbonic anhydrase/acetyltransferase-like protein (isoleucine patch superfamily)
MDVTHHPELIHPTAYIAPNVAIIGKVYVAAEASVWFGCVLRGDNAPIPIGTCTNVQDVTVIYADEGERCTLGKRVTVGHRSVLHSATVKDGALVGIGAIVLNGAVVGQEALVGAGALIPERMIIPLRHLVLGVPARIVRELTDDEVKRIHRFAARYVARAREFLSIHIDQKGE